jgi:hypothetical protein
MGLFDSLLGRRKLKGPAPDRLFALTTTALDLEMQHEIRSGGAAAIVFQPLASGEFQQIVGEVEEVLKGTGEETGSTVEQHVDDFGYRWTIVRDPDVDDLVVGLNAVAEQLQLAGFGDRLLCAVFAFADGAVPGGKVYFIYNFKRGSWYPFVPAGGAQQRNTERELQVKAMLPQSFPVEAELERWFPLWGIPI